MRIDRRGNTGHRNIPAFGDIVGNPCATEVRQPGNARAESIREDRGKRDDNFPSAPSDSFSDLECRDSGFLKKLANLFTAVGCALKDIKQGNSKTFD